MENGIPQPHATRIQLAIIDLKCALQTVNNASHLLGNAVGNNTKAYSDRRAPVFAVQDALVKAIAHLEA